MPESTRSFVGPAVGSLIRFRRRQLGLSQQALGQLMNLTAQQIQKYERGTNALRLQRLVDFSRVLRCPLSFFLQEIECTTPSQSRPHSASTLKESTEIFSAPHLPNAPLEQPPFSRSTNQPGYNGHRDPLNDFLLCFLSLDENTRQAITVLVQTLAAGRKRDSGGARL